MERKESSRMKVANWSSTPPGMFSMALASSRRTTRGSTLRRLSARSAGAGCQWPEKGATIRAVIRVRRPWSGWWNRTSRLSRSCTSKWTGAASATSAAIRAG